MTSQQKQITITLDADALDTLERYQQAHRTWLAGVLSPHASELLLSVTAAARELAAKIDGLAVWPQEAMIIADMTKERLAKAKDEA